MLNIHVEGTVNPHLNYLWKFTFIETSVSCGGAHSCAIVGWMELFMQRAILAVAEVGKSTLRMVKWTIVFCSDRITEGRK